MASGQTRELEEREAAYRTRLRKRMLEEGRLLGFLAPNATYLPPATMVAEAGFQGDSFCSTCLKTDCTCEKSA